MAASVERRAAGGLTCPTVLAPGAIVQDYNGRDRRVKPIAWIILILLVPLPARAQLDAPAEAPLPEKQPPGDHFRSMVRGHRPSPEWTQDRSFTSTRFWLLDPGN